MSLLYIDPGVGSLIFQALLSGALTVVVFYKRIIAMIRQKFGKAPDTISQDDKSEPD